MVGGAVQQSVSTLGSLSKKYESGSSGAGTIANNAGDWGGKSYGTYQIATNTGTMNNFMSWLKKNDSASYKELSRHGVGSSGFDKAWKRLASSGSRFANSQHQFIKATHFDPVVNRAKKDLGISFDQAHPAIQDVVWSVGVQHGSAGAIRIFKNAGIKKGMSNKEVIERIYNERSKVNTYFSRSSQSIKNSVYNRFQREKKDALAMLS